MAKYSTWLGGFALITFGRGHASDGASDSFFQLHLAWSIGREKSKGLRPEKRWKVKTQSMENKQLKWLVENC